MVGLGCLMAGRIAPAQPAALLCAQCIAHWRRKRIHDFAITGVELCVSGLVVLCRTVIHLLLVAVGIAVVDPIVARRPRARGEQGGGRGQTPESRARGLAHFKLMVVFTPWLVVESSNQRAVIVLVCV